MATVSRVLNNKPGISAQARKVVLKAVNSGGYRSRSMSGTPQVALVYATPDPETVLRGYDADLAAGAYAGVVEQHASLAITDLTHKDADETYTQYFLRNNIDGVLLRVSSSSRAAARQIVAEGFPCVVVSDRFDGEPISYVDYDSRVGMARAMEHLFELGHRRVGLAINAVGDDTDHEDRLAAYREGLARHKIECDPSLILPTITSGQGGASAVDQFLAMADPPTAIVFTNPPPTVGAIRRALQRGISVPGELSIVGYDNGELRHAIFPAYSAVYQDAEHIGRLAVTALVERMQDRSMAPARVVIPTVFEANETTGSPGLARANRPAVPDSRK